MSTPEARAVEALNAKLDQILTDVDYEGGLQFWIQKHDALLGQNIQLLQSLTAERERVRVLEEAAQDALDDSVDAKTYPDGPCLPKATRDKLRAALATPERKGWT